MFWVYGFPILMVVVLGIAFRNKPVELIPVDVVAGPKAEQIAGSLSISRQHRRRFSRGPQDTGGDFQARNPFGRCLPPAISHREDRSGRRCRIARVVNSLFHSLFRRDALRILIRPRPPGKRVGRSAVDDRLQRAAGRKDAAAVIDSPVDEAGGRYIDFLVPGLLGMSLWGAACGAWAM